jgi:hypothetical protein
MTPRTPDHGQIRYRSLFPDWSGPRPVSWFFMENLLEARAGSVLPTNADGMDEEINVYLADLLARFLSGRDDERVQPGAAARLLPPARTLTRRDRAQWYRANGDHRLLALGLADRGDRVRRRKVPLGRHAAGVRAEDLETGRLCYDTAANLLGGRGGALGALAPVMRRLADHFEEYVGVLARLATRRFGLGAVLDAADLSGLMRQDPADSPADMDALLDLVNDYRGTAEPALLGRIHALAAGLGVDPSRLGLAVARPVSGRRRTG